ncbi:MAG: hypothetical protein RJA01_45, partial [Actinomycetota bacterium]
MRLGSLISLSETTQTLLQSSNSNLIAIPSATPFLIAEQSKENQILLVAHSSQRATELTQELAELI